MPSENSKHQYLNSGLVHTRNDIEISQDQVKKVQKSVNDHMNWLKDIFNVGLNWNHTDRMARNLKDKGEQTCLMKLLPKDHKGLEHTSCAGTL